MTINPDETVIQGGWEFVEGRMVPDAALRRIQQFVQNRLQKIVDTSDGWETLFRDPLHGDFGNVFIPKAKCTAEARNRFAA